MKKKLTVGSRVYWTDPDEDLCSGPGTIRRISGSELIILKDDGGEVGAYKSEVRLLDA